MAKSTRSCLAVVALSVLLAITAPAQVFTSLESFSTLTGSQPTAALVQGIAGNLFGAASGGGGSLFCNDGCGTVFELNSTGLKAIYRFCEQPNCQDGETPPGPLVLGTDGNFWGTTQSGGTSSNCGGPCGTVFTITPTGALSTVYSFCSQVGCPDGETPRTGLIQGADGNFYGATSSTVFKLTPGAVLTTLYNFYANGTGEFPSNLLQAPDGNFYGTTIVGGNTRCNPPYGCGIIFKLSSNGKLTTLYEFDGHEGLEPVGGLIFANDGNLYGTTTAGGLGGGTVFQLTPGKLKTIYEFCSQPGCIDGSVPQGTLTQGNDGNLYGTTFTGGANSFGTIFRITLQGTLTTLYNFQGLGDGSYPTAGLVQATDGNFYGTTQFGGAYGEGTIYRLSAGLSPFVSFVRNPARVGQTFAILGQGLTGTMGVSVNGTPASFSIVSDTFIQAVVPPGATTGPVTVMTPAGTRNSNVSFRVLPQVLSFSPPSGPVGTQVTITGVSLTQTKLVGFGNNVPANFTVNSDTQLTATVPAGAQTGSIGVQTQGGTAISTQVFTVTQ